MHAEEPQLLADVDSQLSGFVDPLNQAIVTRTCLALILPWQRIPYVSLLPFHIHLRWPDRLRSLPLNPRIGVVPFFESDASMAATPLYTVADVTRARREARVLRHKEGRCIEGDLTEQDWESKVKKRFSRFSALKLPASSYVAIDRLNADGDIRQGHRSVLGRLARSGPRPSVLVPARRGISARAASAFTNLDLLVVNAQGIRGQRTLSTLRAALLECVSRTPTLLVASSPSDLTSLLDEEATNQIQVRFMGKYPSLAKVTVFRVGQDRSSCEREFDFAVQDLREKAPILRELVDLARAAWWAIRQALRPSSDEPPELQRFLGTYERALRDVGGDVSLLEGVRALLLREHQNLELRTERAHATVDAILSAPGRSGPLVLVRDEDESRFLVEALSRELGVDSRTLGELGVQVTGRRAFWPDRPVDSVVAAGYFGARTLDTLLACRARELRLILDPIEARAVWFHADKMARVLRLASATEVESSIRSFAKAVSPHVAAFGDVTGLSLSVTDLAGGVGHDIAQMAPPSQNHARVIFADGTSIEVSMQSRFEVIREAGKRLKTLKAKDLEPGDQVIVLKEDSRELFSERLLATLDQGPLANQAQKRATWLALVQSMYAAQRISPTAIMRALAEKGHVVDLATVRSWLRLDSEEASVPDRPDRFLAFASALGMAIALDDLMEIYRGVESWRINHRKFGRELARAVRAAYLGRLDAPTQRKVERDWGLKVRQLLEGARVAIVDDVILPEGEQDGAH
jgi:hypothetical protein